MKKIFLTTILTLAAAASAFAQTVPPAQNASKAVSPNGDQVLRRVVPKFEIRGRRMRKMLTINADAAFVKRIADNLEKRLKDKCVGYSFQVAFKDTNLVAARAGGVARRAPDANPRAFRTEDKISIASVSKTITAIALLKLLAEKNIDIGESIAPHLPKSIGLHSSIKNITFRELLTHTSGIRWTGEPDYALLLTGLKQGVKPENKNMKCNNSGAGACYNNSNFGLMRILIPFIESGYEPPATANDYAKSYLYGIRTMQATEKRVFAPLGISGVFCNSPQTADKALSYQFPAPVQQGQDWGDMTATNAYRGWNLSAPQMSKIISALAFSEKLLPAALRDKMFEESLGIWHDEFSGIDEYGHGGWHPGTHNLGEIGTYAGAFSNGITVALIINSQYATGISSAEAFRPAILEAMQTK